jgi:hypothetical protein
LDGRGEEDAKMKRKSIAVALCLVVLLLGSRGRALDRAPEMTRHCICVGGASVEWIEGSTVGPVSRWMLDWPGARHRCRPVRPPAGAPGEGGDYLVAEW